ncbi:MAG: BON domain-containing protein [Magnetospirillum sp.]|nr:BON domain-containing protein [Magnetospirillum sp.]
MTKFRAVLAAALVGASAAALPGCVPMLVGAGAEAGTAAAEDRGLEGAIDDTKIRAQINDLWFRKDVDMYRQVGLTVFEGRVLLTGVVPTEQARTDAVRLTWQASGVKDVYNEIHVDPNGEALIDSGRDTVIAEKLKAKLLFDKDIQNINYRVDVVDGVIYLMGIAQNQDELDRVIAYARDIPDVTQVISHVVLKDDPKRVSG